MVDALSWSQPSLLESRPPVRIRFEALVDPIEETVVLSIEARAYPLAALIALTSTGPVRFDLVEDRARELGREFTDLLREHTGPF